MGLWPQLHHHIHANLGEPINEPNESIFDFHPKNNKAHLTILTFGVGNFNIYYFIQHKSKAQRYHHNHLLFNTQVYQYILCLLPLQSYQYMFLSSHSFFVHLSRFYNTTNLILSHSMGAKFNHKSVKLIITLCLLNESRFSW